MSTMRNTNANRGARAAVITSLASPSDTGE
jgi:hypothetical protein